MANYNSQYTGEQIDAAVGAVISGQIGGLSNEAKAALLACFEKVAWVDEHGQDYYDALYNALYPPADLTSITCVYTQSGTVYDTDTLNSLKSDLVVTAHYTDTSTQTITTYTLSGSLTVGTSTITVMYGGKSTTFTVTVTEYVPVMETIEWSGSGTDSTSSLIDATQNDIYITVPYEEDASQLGTDAAPGGDAYKARGVRLYSDSTETTTVGYYFIDTEEIEENQRTTANAPWLKFDTEYLIIPKGYYARLLFSKSGNVFVDNARSRSYLNTYGNSVELK